MKYRHMKIDQISQSYYEQNIPLRKIRTIEISNKPVEVFEKERGLVELEKLNELAEQNIIQKKEGAKKVLFVDFKTLGKMPENENYSFQNFVNLGLHRLQGYLSEYEIDSTIVRISELRGNPEKIAELLNEHDIIGISNLTGQVEEAYEFCRSIKSEFGDKKLVVSGSEHSLAYDHILADRETTGIDACCNGQGEIPIFALALGIPKEEVGSLAYREDIDNNIRVIQNKPFKRLVDGASCEDNNLNILNVRQASQFELTEVTGAAPFNELNGLDDFKFDGTFVTQTGSGCQFPCDFCPSKKFFGAGFKGNFSVAKQEIMEFKKSFPEMKEVFLTFTDAMLNPSNSQHLKEVIDFMTQSNNEPGPKISWFAYLSAPKLEAGESIEEWRIRWDKTLGEMAGAGCIMAGVGVEEIIYDRNMTYHKGQDVDTASEFIDLVGKHMLTRSLLILGGPNQMYLERDKSLKGENAHEKYGSDQDLIKGEILEFMKAHPQALYRMNPWTLVYGTDDFYKYKNCLAVDVEDPSQLKQLDHLHSVIDPEKMYAYIEKDKGVTIPKDKRWVKDKEVWFKLMEEIMEEYLSSSEYLNYIESLKGKETRGHKDLLYKFAMKFRENTLGQITKNRSGRKK